MKHQPTSKLLLIGVVVIALAVIAFIFLNYHANKGVVPVQVPTTAATPASGQWPSTKVSDQTINDTASYYSIKATYPVAKDAVISADFKTFIDSSIAQFKDDTSWAAGNGASVAPAEAGALSLNITYTEQKATNADNYIFSVDEYSGGAHDLMSTKTFSFSPTGQQVALDALFTNGTNGLKTIAPYVASQLATASGADTTMIAAGTAPTSDNYQSFIVQPTGVTFIFDPYQVAPYSSGQQTVKVPLSVFKSIASPDLFK